ASRIRSPSLTSRPGMRRGALPHIRRGRVLESIELHTIPQFVPFHLQQSGGPALVPVGAVQRALDDVALDLAQRALEIEPGLGDLTRLENRAERVQRG